MSSAPVPRRISGEAGFTLLELLVVTAILGLIAYVALDTVAQDTSSVRFDDTRTRLVSIRNAVVGRPATGQAPGATGFIADMGRVPNCPQELTTDQALTPPTSCTTGVKLNPWQLDIDTNFPPIGTGLGYGWRGPYLHAFRETQCASISAAATTCSATGSQPVALRDGWGNTTTGVSSDGTTTGVDLFGWHLFGPDTSGDLYVQSYGSDGLPDTESYNTPDMYANDYPPAATGIPGSGGLPDALVKTWDYQLQLPGQITVRMTNATSGAMAFTSTYVCASLHYVAKNISTNETWIATLYTNASALPGSSLPGGEAWNIDLPVPTIPATSTSAAQAWLPAGPLALRLRGTTDPAACGASGTPSGTVALLEHTYDKTALTATNVRCRPDPSDSSKADPTYTSPGRACGTSITTTLPPALPQQPIDVTLWP